MNINNKSFQKKIFYKKRTNNIKNYIIRLLFN